ncbi:MAG: transcriptional repressor [Firmicutes bacterium]|nr:transcriptional repressor [Bacillota bacterium]
MLKSRGFRLTEPRKKVIRILSKAKGPLSPYEIQRLLRKENVALNHVTIYRALELLCSLNLAHRVITASGFMRCTLEDRHGCHRYMICRSCGSVAEFSDGSLCERENEIASQMGFYAEQHIAESMGLCSKCSRKKRGGHK